MFPFQRSCELSFKVDDDGKDQFEQTNIEDQTVLENNAVAGVGSMNLGLNINRGRGRGRGRKSASSSSINNDEEEKKKIFHREIERQRRQEMSNLYASLRSTLPADYVKGKRSIGDHLAEAVNYIKDLEKNVKELGEKRDQLKQSVESTSLAQELSGSSNSLPGSVVIRHFTGCMEIEISVFYGDEEFMLSTALQVAFEEGLSIVSCTSTKFHERFIHSIRCEAGDITSIDLNRLQQRLNKLVCG